MRILYPTFIAFMLLITGGCTVIESIFEAGLWAGIIAAVIVILVILLIVWLIKKAGS